ncbi:DUF3800 domain-containing protein [Bradyrhizobium sp. HKCCYLRH2015]|uniref:DUF3800 domain-containing protein n=1 Tax=Bradyrhizobium sp. HKCCYLRH2015 TaxID=3420742 RepID=UPI003EBD3077
MSCGFYLFIDEAGDEGLDRIRPTDRNGASEYFVLCGVLVRTEKYRELIESFNKAKQAIGLTASDEVHFRDLDENQKLVLLRSLSQAKFGLVAIVSNKRNMRGYRNLRCEAKNLEFLRGRYRPSRYNWFYNNLTRYLLERASAECRRWTIPAYREVRCMEITFSLRKEFSYSQTRAYLFKIKTERHDRNYFNNRGQIDWPLVDLRSIVGRKNRDEPGLQIADCAGSAIFRALDESWFGDGRPEYLEMLSGKFIHIGSAPPRGYGFKLLPDGFRGPTSANQKRALNAVGYKLR